MHSFASCLIHCVWSTKDRTPFLDPNLRSRLWPYLGGIARENKMRVLAAGGVADHVHMLVSLPATLSIANTIQLLRATPRNGFMKHFRSSAPSNGKWVTAPSASEYQAWERRPPTSMLRKFIIE